MTESSDKDINGTASPGPPKDEENSDHLVGELIEDEPGEIPRPPPPNEKSPPGRPPLSPKSNEDLAHRRAHTDMSDISFDGPGASQRRSTLFWDASEVAEAIDASKKVVEPPSTVKEVLTFADLNDACPMEAEAETIIMKALEEKKERVHPEETILPAVPVEGVSVFTDEEKKEEDQPVGEVSGSALKRFQQATNIIRKSNTTTNTKLAGLANAMRMINEDTGVNELNTETAEEAGEAEASDPQCNTDNFLRHADVLFKQSSLQREEHARLLSEVEEAGDIEEGDPTSTEDAPQDSVGNTKRRKTAAKMKGAMAWTGKEIKHELVFFSEFVEPRRAHVLWYIKVIVGGFIAPMVIAASILFYAVNNPDLGREGASISWFLLFLVRHSVTYAMARATEFVTIDYLTLTKRFTVSLFGPVFALFMVQSKGYPAIVSWWAIYGLLMLSGRNVFAKHWLFWQTGIDMCNANNPAGTITESRTNFAILSCALAFGICVAAKRLWLGLYLGKRTYTNYGAKLCSVMNKILLISEVAALSKRKGVSAPKLPEIANMTFEEQESHQSENDVLSHQTARIGLKYYESDQMSKRMLISEYLGAWEEPEVSKEKPTDASITDVLQFRQALTFVNNTYPFSAAFGPADKRNACIESGQKVYERLLVRQGTESADLHFDVIAELAVNTDDSVNTTKLKELVRLFRPHREGTLTLIDFLKSVDSVYKEFRLLQASVENSGSVDRSFEIFFNWFFFIILWCIILYIIGIDPIAMFVSFSAFIVGFSFCIGGASSNFFEGILLVLCRRPYDIGDRIHVSDPESDTSLDGSLTWFVEDLDLFTTTVRLAATNEVGSYNNGSLARSRIINAARSPQAVVFVPLKISVNVSYELIQLFRRTIEKFVKDRPREWLSLLGFRAGAVEQDQGWIQYIIVLQHRESWQNIGAILTSKADVASFSLEVAKQLGMDYEAPPLPVLLGMSGAKGGNKDVAAGSDSSTSPEMRAIASMFQRT